MHPIHWLSSLLIVLLAGACAGGPDRISGQPPQMDIRLLQQTEQEMLLDIDLRNVNDQPLTLGKLEFTLEHDQRLLARFDQATDVEITSRGRESISLNAPLAPVAQEVLTELAEGTRTSLPWKIRGRVIDQTGRTWPVETSGHLYPVPGRAGQFR